MPVNSSVDLLGAPLRILILSPQPWAGLQVSKHHYAREAAKLGHDVIFANPPGGAARIALSASGIDNLTLLDHPAMAMRRTKFRARPLFDAFARRRAKAIAAEIGTIDLLWDFDNAGQFTDHRAFGARRSILHVMDQPEDAARHGRKADIIFGVAPSLIANVPPRATPRHVIAHGLAPLFADIGRERLASGEKVPVGGDLVVGFLGNLAQPWMDRGRLLTLIEANPALRFRFIGPVQDSSAAAQLWVDRLRTQPHVELAGLKSGAALEDAMRGVHIWLLYYDRDLDPNKGVNSHKLLEYFATGAEVVSSHISAQAEAPGVFMAPADAPDHVAILLNDAVGAVREGRDTGWRDRIADALKNSYAANFRLIAAHLSAR